MSNERQIEFNEDEMEKISNSVANYRDHLLSRPDEDEDDDNRETKDDLLAEISSSSIVSASAPVNKKFVSCKLSLSQLVEDRTTIVEAKKTLQKHRDNALGRGLLAGLMVVTIVPALVSRLVTGNFCAYFYETRGATLCNELLDIIDNKLSQHEHKKSLPPAR